MSGLRACEYSHRFHWQHLPVIIGDPMCPDRNGIDVIANDRKQHENQRDELMSATLEHPSQNDTVDELPDASVLHDKTPEWVRTPAVSAAFTAFLGVLLITLFANRPLWHTDLWDHVNYGEQFLNDGSLPVTEPSLLLARGMPMVHTSWLSQIGLASLFEAGGVPALQFAYGLLVVLSVGFIGWATVRRGGSAFFGFVACTVFLLMNWQQFLVVRPQLVGVLCFSVLVSQLLTGGPKSRHAWWALPLMFTLWANCHGSFGVGLLCMALAGAGHFADVLFRTRSFRMAFACRQMWRLILLTQLCAAAVLINPNGIQLYHEVLRVGQHPNIATMFEWDALTLRMKQGQVAAAMVLLLAVVLKLSPRRIHVSEVLLLAATGGLACWSARMINWWSPVMAIVIGSHGASAWRHLMKQRRSTVQPNRTGLWTVVNVGLCWIFFAFTPLGVQIVHGRTADLSRSLSPQTPLNTIGFLNSMEELPPGPTFVPAEWSGAVTQFGPSELQPMVNLHVHIIPEEIWTDYVRLLSGPADWDGLLDRYGINLVVAEKVRSERLVDELRRSEDWEVLFEDAQSVVTRRIDIIR